MAKLIVRYQDGVGASWGILTGDAPTTPERDVVIEPLTTNAVSTSALIAALDAGETGTAQAITVKAGRLLTPMTSDTTIICQGLNYGEHAAESNHDDRSANLLFNKASSALTGPYADVVRPAEVQLLDYEVEFGLVMRKDITGTVDIDDANIGDFVAGVVLANDVSARDTMFGASFLQWFEGKSYRTFCPTGPALWYLDRAEVAEALQSIEISLWLNDELRQSAQSSQLIWKPAETLSHISTRIDFKRGDLLLTGTPGGVTAPATPALVSLLKDMLFDDEARREAFRSEMLKARPFMQPGDTVTAQLRDLRTDRVLGGLANRITAS